SRDEIKTTLTLQPENETFLANINRVISVFLEVKDSFKISTQLPQVTSNLVTPEQQENHLFAFYKDLTPKQYAHEYCDNLNTKEEITYQKNWHSLFECVWAGDIEMVRRLTINGHPSQAVHVFIKGPLDLTLFHIAVFRENGTMLQELVRIARAQHQPYEKQEQKEKPATATFNNYQLVNEQYLDIESDSSDTGSNQNNDLVDPNKDILDATKVKFVLPPSSVFTVFNVINKSAKFKCGEVIPRHVWPFWLQLEEGNALEKRAKVADTCLTAVDLIFSKCQNPVKMMKCLVDVLLEGEYSEVDEKTCHLAQPTMRTFPRWKLIPDLLHGRNYVCHEISCALMHQDGPINIIIMRDLEELLRYAI
ncbi:hypothetical protein HK096_000077, partial [Nowakowskiella sp. JEL0078]